MIVRHYIKSCGASIYIEVYYPKKIPTSAVIMGHGLRSYYPGFFDMFNKALRKAGYITVKFHFVGTGKSSGLFENKTTSVMLQNYRDVLLYVKQLTNVTNIGILGRSNAGSLAVINGPDKLVKAYVILAAPAYYSSNMGKFVKSAKVKGKFFYHKSFKRPHTKGLGRLPLSYVGELKRYDKLLLKNIPKMKPVIFFQSTNDEAVCLNEGHFDYWFKHLPKPRKFVLIKGSTHSFKGHKRFVINQSLLWLKKYLPIK